MSPSSPSSRRRDAKALATSRRDAMLRRARRIRRTVAALAATLFATAFLIVYVQLASGHDPALVANAAKRRAASTSVGSAAASSSNTATTEATASSTESEAASSDTSSGASESSSASDESSSASEESSSGNSAVTTSQS
jgi:hypothetical protein